MLKPIFFTLLLIVPSHAQSLSVTFDDPAKTGQPGSFIQFHNRVSNNSDQAVPVQVITDKTQLPSGWTCSFCIGDQCYSPMTDSTQVTLPPGESMAVDLDIQTDETAGSGSVDICIGQAGKMNSRTFTVSTTSSRVQKQELLTGSLRLYPQPFDGRLSLESSVPVRTISIYNVLGELVYQEDINGVAAQFNLQLPRGLYFARLATKQGPILKKLHYVR